MHALMWAGLLLCISVQTHDPALSFDELCSRPLGFISKVVSRRMIRLRNFDFVGCFELRILSNFIIYHGLILWYRIRAFPNKIEAELELW